MLCYQEGLELVILEEEKWLFLMKCWDLGKRCYTYACVFVNSLCSWSFGNLSRTLMGSAWFGYPSDTNFGERKCYLSGIDVEEFCCGIEMFVFFLNVRSIVVISSMLEIASLWAMNLRCVMVREMGGLWVDAVWCPFDFSLKWVFLSNRKFSWTVF